MILPSNLENHMTQHHGSARIETCSITRGNLYLQSEAASVQVNKLISFLLSIREASLLVVRAGQGERRKITLCKWTKGDRGGNISTGQSLAGGCSLLWSLSIRGEVTIRRRRRRRRQRRRRRWPGLASVGGLRARG